MGPGSQLIHSSIQKKPASPEGVFSFLIPEGK